MTRSRYVVILPSLIAGFVGVGLVLGILFPGLPSSFYLVLVLLGGGVILLVDRLTRRQVTEALTDERIDRITERSTMIAFRATTAVALVLCFALTAALPSVEALRFIAVGAGCTIGFQGLVQVVAHLVIRSRS